MQVRIYTKENIPLTTLFDGDFEAPKYTDTIKGDGVASFVVRSDNAKLTKRCLKMFNRVRFYEGSKCVFFGFVGTIDYTINTISVTVHGIGYLTRIRTCGTIYSPNGTAAEVLAEMIDIMNAADDTGIRFGSVDSSLAGPYDKDYVDGTTFDSIVEDLFGADVQFRIDPQGRAHLAPILGRDLSQTIKLKYDVTQIENSNIADFTARENAQPVVTSILAQSNNQALIVASDELKDEYGLIEATKRYWNAYSTEQLAVYGNADLSGPSWTPDISLAPTAVDNFDVCDILGVRLFTRLIDVNTAYQVREKTVSYVGAEKTISIRLNDDQKNLFDILIDHKKRLLLLENQ